MLVVTGANGALGRAIVEQLLTRVPAETIIASVRKPGKANALTKKGVQVRQADFTDAASVQRAFEGATKVLIVSVPLPTKLAVPQHRTAIEAARNAGVERILYTSQMGADPKSPFAPMHTHAQTEDILNESGVSFTSLRNGFYASSAMQMFGAALRSGEVIVPEDGPVAWTTHADLAAAAAVALTTNTLDGISSPLTASEALTLDQLCLIAAEIQSRPVKRLVVTDEKFHAHLIATGTPAPFADMTLGMLKAARQGAFSRKFATLRQLINRAPTTMKDWMRENLAA